MNCFQLRLGHMKAHTHLKIVHQINSSINNATVRINNNLLIIIISGRESGFGTPFILFYTSIPLYYYTPLSLSTTTTLLHTKTFRYSKFFSSEMLHLGRSGNVEDVGSSLSVLSVGLSYGMLPLRQIVYFGYL